MSQEMTIACRRLLLLGGGNLLVRLAAWAKDKGHPVQIITSPRHAEEIVGQEGNSLAKQLEKNSVPVLVTETITGNEAQSAIGDPNETFSLSLGAAWIFSAETIEGKFGGRLFNLHGTRLPQYRGGGAFSWQIMCGNRLGFCVLHKIEPEPDEGKLLAVEEFLYPNSCRTPLDFMIIYIDKNFEFVTEILAKAFDGGIAFSPVGQPNYISTYWPRLHAPTHSWVDWSLNASEIERFICAFDEPYHGAQSLWNGQPVYLRGAIADFNEGTFHPFQAGLVFRKNGSWLHVAAKGGNVIVQSITDADGKSLMSMIRNGDRLITPHEKLDHAKQRVIYTPSGLK